MSNIEKVIRKLLLEIDTNNPAERRKVYESAWKAQERYLINNHNIDEDSRNQKRADLTKIIRKVEFEYRPAPPQASTGPARLKLSGPRPSVTAPEHVRPHSAPVRPGTTTSPHRAKHFKNRNRFIVWVLGSVFTAVALFIVWSFYNSLAGSMQNPTPTNTTTLTKTITRPIGADMRYSDGWVRIFNPQDVMAFTIMGSAKAQIFNEDKESFVRITANSIDDVVVFNIGAGALAPLRNQMVTIDIIARSSTDTPSQLVVTCDFGNGNDCGRIRFEVPVTREDLLFNMTVPANSSGQGKLRVTSDLSAGGQGVDIYGVLIRNAQ